MTSITDPTLLLDPKPDGPPSAYGSGESVQGDIRLSRIEVISTADDAVNITEPSTPTHPQFPYNHVYQSISGHLIEEDDTPGAERLLRQHKAGTFDEIHPDGSRVIKVFGKDYYLILDDHTLFVGGNLNISVQGNANLLVAGNLKTKVGGDVDTTIHGNYTTRVTGKTLLYSKGDIDIQSAGKIQILSNQFNVYSTAGNNIQTAGNTTIRSGGTGAIWADGRLYLDGSRVDFKLPGPNPSNLTVKNLDPGPGLEVPDSIIQPSVESQMAVRSDNVALLQTVNDGITFPKDRKKFSDIPDTDN